MSHTMLIVKATSRRIVRIVFIIVILILTEIGGLFVKFECHACSVVCFCLVITLSPHYIKRFLLAAEDDPIGERITFADVELAILTLVLRVRSGVVTIA